MAHHEQALRVAAELSGVVVSPAHRLRHVAHDSAHIDRGEQPVVGRNEHVAFFGEHLRLDLHVLLVAGLPAAAVDPEHDGQALPVLRVMHVEHLALVPVLDVRDVALDLLRARVGRERENQQCGSDSHGRGSVGSACFCSRSL